MAGGTVTSEFKKIETELFGDSMTNTYSDNQTQVDQDYDRRNSYGYTPEQLMAPNNEANMVAYDDQVDVTDKQLTSQG